LNREGPGNERWLIGKHVDRILEATTAPIFWENLDERVWRTAIGHSVYALAHIAAPYASEETQDEWGGRAAECSVVEDWLAWFGDVYEVLREAGLVGWRRTPEDPDAAGLLESLLEDPVGVQEASGG